MENCDIEEPTPERDPLGRDEDTPEPESEGDNFDNWENWP
jgi:hypothetical protein